MNHFGLEDFGQEAAPFRMPWETPIPSEIFAPSGRELWDS